MNNAELKKKIYLAISSILKEKNYISPVDVLIGIRVLATKDYERVPYLEKVCKVNLHKLSFIIKEIRTYAKQNSLKSSMTVYKQCGVKGRKILLRFSKSGGLIKKSSIVRTMLLILRRIPILIALVKIQCLERLDSYCMLQVLLRFKKYELVYYISTIILIKVNLNTSMEDINYMRVGIIIYSWTGNTYSVAKRIEERLLQTGHSVAVERIEIAGEKHPQGENFEIRVSPDVNSYDVVIFGSPVEGFAVAPVMKRYLSQLPSLQHKNIACFVTQFFPYPWMGGNRAISQMTKLCEAKGGVIISTSIVNWKNKHREELIIRAVNHITSSITNVIKN